MIDHPVPYEYGGKQYEGRIVYDDSVSGKRPAIYMQPDWLGVCSHTVEMAVDAGQSDYVVLLVDMYGKDYGGMKKTNEELGREFSVGVRLTGPVPSDGKVKEEVESLVERCREFAAIGGPFRLGLPRLTVDCPLDLSCLPHDGENVKVIGECTGRELEGFAGVLVFWPLSSVMESS